MKESSGLHSTKGRKPAAPLFTQITTFITTLFWEKVKIHSKQKHLSLVQFHDTSLELLTPVCLWIASSLQLGESPEQVQQCRGEVSVPFEWGSSPCGRWKEIPLQALVVQESARHNTAFWQQLHGWWHAHSSRFFLPSCKDGLEISAQLSLWICLCHWSGYLPSVFCIYKS